MLQYVGGAATSGATFPELLRSLLPSRTPSALAQICRLVSWVVGWLGLCGGVTPIILPAS